MIGPEGIQERLPIGELDIFEARLDAAQGVYDITTRLLDHTDRERRDSQPVMAIHKRASAALAAITLTGINAGYLATDIKEK